MSVGVKGKRKVEMWKRRTGAYKEGTTVFLLLGGQVRWTEGGKGNVHR